MRSLLLIACLALAFTFIHAQYQTPYYLNVWRYTGYNYNIINEVRNFDCVSGTGCIGPFPNNYTDETIDNVRTWYCGDYWSNITILMGWNVVWPGLFIYQGTGWYNESCFALTVEGDSTFSIYQGGLYFFETMDFKASNCLLSSTANFEIRSLAARPFNPKSFDSTDCPGALVVKAYTGLDIGELKTKTRRVAWRSLRGNVTLPNNGRTHRWTDYPPESVMEIGNWPGFEPVFNVYGNFVKDGIWKSKTILTSTTSTAKMTWHFNSTVTIQSTWKIEDMKPTSGPNTMNGKVYINNTNFQFEGNWAITPSAEVSGPLGGNNNMTYLGASSGNTLTLGGAFSNINFFANTTTGNYLTTGSFSNCNAQLTDRATNWSWNRQGVPGVVTFNTVTLGSNLAITLTLRNGDFAFNTLAGPGVVNLVNATLTVAGTAYHRP